MRIGQTPEQSQPVPSIFHRIRTELYKKYGNEAILNVFRACSFPTGLSASTNQAGENMDRASSVDFLTFCTVLKDLGIFMTDQEVTQLDYADISRDGCLSSYELMALLRGDFDHPGRRRVVYQAWERLDPKRTGAVDVAKLENCFSAQRHPMVNEKKKTEQDVFEEFMSQLTPHSQNGKEKVTREEFWTYYGGVSAGIIDDATFECLVRNTWNMASANEKLFLRNEELYNSLLKNYKTASSYGLTTEQKEAQSLTPAFSQKNVLLDSKLNDVPRASYFSLLQRPAAPGASNPYLTTYQRYGSLPQEKCCTPPIIHRRAHPTTGTENAELQLTLQGLLSTKAKLDAEIAEEESKNSKEVEDATQRTHDKRNMVAELRPEVMKTYFDGREEEIKIDQHRRNLLQTPLQSSSAERSIRWNTTYRTYHTHLLPAVDRTARETALYVESTLRPPSREPMWKDPAARKAIADRVRARGKQTVGYAEPHGVTQASTWIAGTLQTTTQASRYLLPALQDPSESETQYLQDLEKRSQQRVHATHGDGHELQVAIARNALETHKYDRKALMVRSGDPLYKTQSRSLKWWDGDRQPNRYVTTYRLNTVSNYPRNELMPLSQS